MIHGEEERGCLSRKGHFHMRIDLFCENQYFTLCAHLPTPSQRRLQGRMGIRV